MHPYSAPKKGEQLEVRKEISWPFRNSKLQRIKYSLSEVTCGLVECNYLKIISMKQLVCSGFSARCVVVLNFCWSISLHPKIGQCRILEVGATEGPHLFLLLSADLFTAVLVKWVVNAEVLNLMCWTGSLGNEVFTRQVSQAIRYGDNHKAHFRDSPQVFKCSGWRGWTLGFQSHSWFFLKLNCRQKELRLEHSVNMYILEVISVSSWHLYGTASSGRGGDFISVMFPMKLRRNLFLRLTYYLNHKGGLVIGRVAAMAICLKEAFNFSFTEASKQLFFLNS